MKTSNRQEIDELIGAINKRSKRLQGYCDTYARSGNADIKHIQLITDEINELNEALSQWITYQAIGGSIDVN